MRMVLATLLSLAGIVGLFGPTDAYSDPRSHYLIHCMGCHLQDGSGTPPDVPVFDEGLLDLLKTDSGRAYLVQVPGGSQSPISDEALTSVLNWTLREFGGLNESQALAPISLDEVRKYRPMTLLNPVKTRADMAVQ